MERGHFYDEWVTKEDKADEEDKQYDGSEYQMRRMGVEWSFFCSVLSSSIFISEKNKKQAVLGVIACINKTTLICNIPSALQGT
jgi:hypothetical protein